MLFRSETGEESAAQLERDIANAASQAGVRILGPNGMGLYHPAGGLAFRPDLPLARGNVAFLSQSGNNAVEIVVRGAAQHNLQRIGVEIPLLVRIHPSMAPRDRLREDRHELRGIVRLEQPAAIARLPAGEALRNAAAPRRRDGYALPEGLDDDARHRVVPERGHDEEGQVREPLLRPDDAVPADIGPR